MGNNKHISTRNIGMLSVLAVSACLQFDYLFFNVYFALPFVVVILCCVYIIAFKNFSIFNLCAIIGLFFILLIYVLALGNQASLESIRRSIVYYGYVGLAIFVAAELVNKSSLEEIRVAMKAMILVSLLAVTTETIFRFFMPTLDLREIGDEQLGVDLGNEFNISDFIISQYFYAYKYSSIMFFDSNFVAIFLIPIIILNLFYINRIEKSFFLVGTLVLGCVLMILTLSRSGIIVASMILIINYISYLYGRNKWTFLAVIFMLCLCFSFLSIQFLDALTSDGSLVSKIDIFRSLNSIWRHDVLNVLFGFGVEEGGYIYSYQSGAYAHALIPLILGQFGVVGFIFYVIIFSRLSYLSGYYGWLLFLAIFIMGFSLADPMQITIYLAFLLMARFVLIESRRG